MMNKESITNTNIRQKRRVNQNTKVKEGHHQVIRHHPAATARQNYYYVCNKKDLKLWKKENNKRN
jgi:hypothetical protein